MNQGEEIHSKDEETNLKDYIRIVLKRKRLILVVFAIMVAAGIIFSFLSPKIYKIDTSLEIGRIGGEIIEGPLQVVEKVKGDVYGILIREKLRISERKYPKIKAENPKGTNLVGVTIESANSAQAKNILEEIDKLILENHQEKIRIKQELLRKDIERLKNKTSFLEEEKKNLEEKVEALQKVLPYQQTPGSQFALFDTKEKLEGKKQEIENLYLEINSLQRSLEDIQPTEVSKRPTVSEKPIRPRPALYSAIAAVLGLIIGTFFACAREEWKKTKE